MIGAGLIAALLLVSPVMATGPQLIIRGEPLSPGQTLLVESASYTRKAPQLIWGEYEVPFYRNQSKIWRALIRVPLESTPGKAMLQVVMPIDKGIKTASIPLNVEINEANFGSETLTFSPEKAKLLNDPSEDEESRLIREYLKKSEIDDNQRWSGPFQAPVPGEMISEYGLTRNKTGQDKPDFHRGVDFRAERGEPILSPAGAKVLMVKNFKFHGGTVLLSHGQGVGSIYIHMDSIDVKEGQIVKAGSKLGEVGSTGLATAPHLHWGVYVHGKAVNPVQWLETSF